VKHGLGGIELGDWWQDTTSITGEENNVAGVVGRQTWDLGVLNVLNGVSAG